MKPPNTITRKKLLQAGAAAGIAGLVPLPIQAASRTGSYRGKITVYGIAVPSPGHPGVIKLFQDFDKAHPSISIENHGFPSERFVALFTAAQASGEQIDMLWLNGQDLRRYALAHSVTFERELDIVRVVHGRAAERDQDVADQHAGLRRWSSRL